MSDEEIQEKPVRNNWHLVFGILFLCYGSFRLYQNTTAIETDNFGIALSIGFILFGFNYFYKYYSRT